MQPIPVVPAEKKQQYLTELHEKVREALGSAVERFEHLVSREVDLARLQARQAPML